MSVSREWGRWGRGNRRGGLTEEGNGACPSLGSTCLHWWHRALLISVQVSKCSPGMTAWHSQHPHRVTGAGSRSHCLPLMSMSLMEMEESEGHISIQIASILSAIHLAWLGPDCRRPPSGAPLIRFCQLILCMRNAASPRHPACSPLLPSSTYTPTQGKNMLSTSRNKVGARSPTLSSTVVNYSCLIREYLVRASNEVPIV